MIITSFMLAIAVWVLFILVETSREFALLFGMLAAIWCGLVAIYGEIKKKNEEK